jgi:heptosyltransferase I
MRRPSLDRIAIVMMSAIGDAIHVLPVINALKRHAPRARITWILEPKPASLVRGHPAIDEIIEFSRRRGVREWLELRRVLRERDFDVALDFQVAIKAGLVTSFVRAPVKLGFDVRRARDLNWLFTNEKIPPHADQHVQDQYFEFLDHLRVPHGHVEWKLGPWPHERDMASALIPSSQHAFASIATSTSRAERDWPAERWAQVIDAMYERFDLRSMLVGGRSPRELEAERIIMARSRHKPFSTLGCSLRELVAVLNASALVLSPNTAPMHMAVALHRPVISLFATSEHARYGPRRTGPYRASQDLIVNAFRRDGGPDEVLMTKRGGRIETIQVEDVLAKVELWHGSYR